MYKFSESSRCSPPWLFTYNSSGKIIKREKKSNVKGKRGGAVRLSTGMIPRSFPSPAVDRAPSSLDLVDLIWI